MLSRATVDHRALLRRRPSRRRRRGPRLRRRRPGLAPARRARALDELAGRSARSASDCRRTVGNPDELLALADDPAAPAPQRDHRPSRRRTTRRPSSRIDWVGSVDNAATSSRRCTAARNGWSSPTAAPASRSWPRRCGRSGRHDVRVARLAGARRAPRAEARIREARDCVIVATSTLELGIDVGDLDRVIQLGAPRDRRFAAAARRSHRAPPGSRRNCLFLATRDSELLQALALGERVAASWVEPLVAPPLPVPLIGQQLLALVLSEGRVARSDWPDALERVFSAAALSRAELTAALDHAVDQAIVRDDGGVLTIGPAGEETYGFRHFREVMSLFLSDPLLTVRFGRRDIGTVDPSAVSRGPDGGRPVLLLGGRSWGVRELDWEQRLVWVEPSDAPGRIRWAGDGRALSFELAQAQRRVLAGDAVPVEERLTRRGRQRLDELRGESVPYLRAAPGSCRSRKAVALGGGRSPAG